MKRWTALLGVALIAGCGDPAPSTPIAPDKPPLDGSKMSKEELDRLHQAENAGSKHTPGR
jgi:hypothetical protein